MTINIYTLFEHCEGLHNKKYDKKLWVIEFFLHLNHKKRYVFEQKIILFNKFQFFLFYQLLEN